MRIMYEGVLSSLSLVVISGSIGLLLSVSAYCLVCEVVDWPIVRAFIGLLLRKLHHTAYFKNRPGGPGEKKV